MIKQARCTPAEGVYERGGGKGMKTGSTAGSSPLAETMGVRKVSAACDGDDQAMAFATPMAALCRQ
jgi:hypothetical protein